MSSLQKMFAAIRQINYGRAQVLSEEMSNIQEESVRLALKEFCAWIVVHSEYASMGDKTEEEIQKLEHANAPALAPDELASFIAKLKTTTRPSS